MKKNLTIGASVLVAGILLWLFQLGGIDYIRTLFPTITIEARSTTREAVETFLTGEKVRFFLQGVRSEKVFWILNEEEVYPGGVQLEYVFPFDEADPLGVTRDHRIDVFFKHDKDYQAVSTMVRTQNIKYQVCVETHDWTMSILASRSLGDHWVFDNGWLSQSENGIFQRKVGLTFEPVADTAEVVGTTVTAEAWSQVLTRPEYLAWSEGLPAGRRPNVWLTYEFVDLDGDQRLEIAKSLSDILSEECPLPLR